MRISEDYEGSPDGMSPLSPKERIVAVTAGALLLSAGALSVFLSENQAGSAALAVVGGVLVLFGINGMPLTSARVMEVEFQMPARLRRAVQDLAAQLPDDEARLVLSTIEAASPTRYAEPLTALIDTLLFEARVRDAAMLTGERLLPRVGPGIGEPLFDIVIDDAHIGVFAMDAPTQHGSVPPEFTEAFVARLPAAGVQGVLLITCAGELSVLVERLTVPAVVVRTGPAGQIPPLGPFLDQLRPQVSGQP